MQRLIGKILTGIFWSLFKTPQRQILTILLIGGLVSTQFQNCAPSLNSRLQTTFGGPAQLQVALKSESQWQLVGVQAPNSQAVPIPRGFTTHLSFVEEAQESYCPGSCPQRYQIQLNTSCSVLSGVYEVAFDMQEAQYKRTLTWEDGWRESVCPFSELEDLVIETLNHGDIRLDGVRLEVVSDSHGVLVFRRVNL